MTNSEAIKVLCDMLCEKRSEREIQAFAKAICALHNNAEVAGAWSSWTTTAMPIKSITYGDKNEIVMNHDATKWMYKGTITNTPNECMNCANHPNNGGSGVCHCTLGSPIVYC